MTSGSSEYFERIKHRVNVALLAEKLVVVVGVGTVGSQIARELANGGVGRLCLIDGDHLETHNLLRHALPQEYLSMNKAEGVARHLAHIPGLRVDAVPSYVDSTMPDRDLDGLLEVADLIVAATERRDVQRRIGRRALSLDIPALFPALYAGGGGEVFVQRSSRFPCFLCWDGFRPVTEPLRGVTGLNVEALSIIKYSVHLCHGVLDRRSSFARALAAESAGQPLPQLFIQYPFGPFAAKPVPWRPGCPSCAVGPAVAEPVGRQLNEYERLRSLCLGLRSTASAAGIDVAPLHRAALGRQLDTGARTEAVFQELRSWLESAAGSVQVPAEDDFQSLNGIAGGIIVGLILGIGGCAQYGATHDPGNPGGYNEGAALGIGFGLLLLCVFVGALIQVVINSNAARKRAALSELRRTLGEVQTYLAQ